MKNVKFWVVTTILWCLLPKIAFAQAETVLPQAYVLYSFTDFAGKPISQPDSTDRLLIQKDGTYAATNSNQTTHGTYTIYAGFLTLQPANPADSAWSFQIISSLDTLRLSAGGYIFTYLPEKEKSAMSFDKSGFNAKHFGRGLIGMFALIMVAFIFSTNRKKINWWLVAKGLGMQVLLAIAILKIDWVADGFDLVGKGFVALLGFTREGSLFLFGNIIKDTNNFGYIFAFQVLPTVVFFSALTSLLYYYNILQKVVYVFAWIMKRTLKLSGAESLAAAGNIFLGQTEAPLLVKPYIAKMTKSELLCLMTGGMATIAGGVLAAYIGYLGGPDEATQLFFARHLIVASVMSAPAAVVAAKMLLPEVEKYNQDMHIARNTIGSNWLDAVANGTTDGLKLAINVGAMLLVFTALIYMFNAILGDVIGHYSGLNATIASFTNGQYTQLSLQFLLGYALAPLTWLMGVNGSDITIVGQLLGEKTILNEFYAYSSMGEMMRSGAFVEQRSVIIATYILCGFANFASIGIQIGGISALAPSRRSDLSKLGVRALIGGTLASLFTAVIVGMLI